MYVSINDHSLLHTVKVTGILLSLQLRYEFSFLSQETIPVKAMEEHVHLHLRGSPWRRNKTNTNVVCVSTHLESTIYRVTVVALISDLIYSASENNPEPTRLLL